MLPDCEGHGTTGWQAKRLPLAEVLSLLAREQPRDLGAEPDRTDRTMEWGVYSGHIYDGLFRMGRASRSPVHARSLVGRPSPIRPVRVPPPLTKLGPRSASGLKNDPL